MDVGRAKYFRFDLEDLMETFEGVEGKKTISANVTAKFRNRSFDEAVEYLERTKGDNHISPEQMRDMVSLMKRYSKWR